MKDFIITKMKESTFDDEYEMMRIFNEDYVILGDEEAFMVYYKIGNVIWVHFLWASSKRLMYRVLKEFGKVASLKDNVILFDCDDFAKMFGSHATKIYVWNKELK